MGGSPIGLGLEKCGLEEEGDSSMQGLGRVLFEFVQ